MRSRDSTWGKREREGEKHNGYWAGAAASFVRQKAGNTKYYNSSCTHCVSLFASVCDCMCMCVHVCLHVCFSVSLHIWYASLRVCVCVCVQVKLKAEVRLDLLNSFARSFVTACTYFYCCCFFYLPTPPPHPNLPYPSPATLKYLLAPKSVILFHRLQVKDLSGDPIYFGLARNKWSGNGNGNESNKAYATQC